MSELEKILPLDLLDYVKENKLINPILLQESQSPTATDNGNQIAPVEDVSRKNEDDSWWMQDVKNTMLVMNDQSV